MKKYLLKIALFFALMAVIDVACGWAFGILRSKLKGGRSYKNEYINNICEEDIMVLGSSKADHHYVPSVFEDSLGLSCYNAGEMGCGIIPAYVRYKIVSIRHKPKLVLYEVTPKYDYLQDNGYSHYLGVIRPYASDPIIKPVYLDFSDNIESLRLLSNMYRNNSCIINVLKDLLKPSPDEKGYEPLFGTINSKLVNKDIQEEDAHEIIIDPLKYKYVEKLIEDTKKDHVPLVFIISPSVRQVNDVSDYEPMFELCQKHSVPLINNIACDSFVGESKYYQDWTHLNHKGAIVYSHYVVSQIIKYIQ